MAGLASRITDTSLVLDTGHVEALSSVAVGVIKSSNDIILRPIDFLWPMSSNWSIFVFNKIYCDPLLNGWSSHCTNRKLLGTTRK